MKHKLCESILQKELFQPNETIVLAISGGVDSMVLFDVLLHLNLNLNIVLAHVNHSQREASKNEYEALVKLAKENGIPFEGITLNQKHRGNFHDEARNQRFDFFEKVAEKHNASKVVLAHHLDDQIETVLMRIVRGSSFIGYGGIQEQRPYCNVTFIRPLMDITKDQILSYAKQNNIQFFEDESNQEDKYTRNRYRHHIIPLLKEENPNFEMKIKQFTSYINMADSFIDKFMFDFMNKHYYDGKISIPHFLKLDQIIQIKVIKELINRSSDDSVEINFNQFQDIIDLVSNQKPNITYNLSGDYDLIKEYNYFYVKKAYDTVSIYLEINDFGEYYISSHTKYIFTDKILDIKHTNLFELWYNDTVFPLYLRNRKNGDRIKLKVGTKKVKDVLIDKKIPSLIRDNLILLANRDTVLWIPSIKKCVQDKNQKNKLYIYEVK